VYFTTQIHKSIMVLIEHNSFCQKPKSDKQIKSFFSCYFRHYNGWRWM